MFRPSTAHVHRARSEDQITIANHVGRALSLVGHGVGHSVSQEGPTYAKPQIAPAMHRFDREFPTYTSTKRKQVCFVISDFRTGLASRQGTPCDGCLSLSKKHIHPCDKHMGVSIGEYRQGLAIPATAEIKKFIIEKNAAQRCVLALARIIHQPFRRIAEVAKTIHQSDEFLMVLIVLRLGRDQVQNVGI